MLSSGLEAMEMRFAAFRSILTFRRLPKGFRDLQRPSFVATLRLITSTNGCVLHLKACFRFSLGTSLLQSYRFGQTEVGEVSYNVQAILRNEEAHTISRIKNDLGEFSAWGRTRHFLFSFWITLFDVKLKRRVAFRPLNLIASL